MESLASTTAIVGCTVTGITTELTGVLWYDSNDGALTGGVYTKDDGSLSGDVQTTTLTVAGGVTVDTSYKCEIHGIKYTATINVYSKFI